MDLRLVAFALECSLGTIYLLLAGNRILSKKAYVNDLTSSSFRRLAEVLDVPFIT